MISSYSFFTDLLIIFNFVNLDGRLECDIDDVVGLIGIMQYVKGNKFWLC